MGAGLWPWLVAGAMFALAAFRLRHLRPGWTELGVFCTALAVSALLMPLSELSASGHEAEYLDLLLGERGIEAANAAQVPAMQWLMWAAGRLGVGEWGARGGMLLAGALACALWSATLARLMGARVGLVGGVVLALWGNLAAWSSSVYNVVLPFFFVCLSIWALSLLLDEEDALGGGLLAGAAAGLAVALRLDAVWVAPAGLLLLALGRPPQWQRWLPGLLLGALLAAGAAWSLRSGGALPGEGDWQQSFALNSALFVYFEPFQRLWVLPAVALGSVLSVQARWRVALPLLLLPICLHLSMAGFNDYGSRHLLPAGLGLSAALGQCVSRRWAWLPLGVAVLGLMGSLADMRQRFYASEERFVQALDEGLPKWSLEELGDCALITEDERIVEGPQLSHFNLWDPSEFAGLQEQHGCVLWLMGAEDYRWSSLAVRDRALRVERLFDLQPLAVVGTTQDGYIALVLRVERARGWPSPSPVRTLP